MTTSCLPRSGIEIPDLRRVHARSPAEAGDAGEVLHDAALVDPNQDLAVGVGLYRGGEQLGKLLVGALAAVDVGGAVLADVNDDLPRRGREGLEPAGLGELDG